MGAQANRSAGCQDPCPGQCPSFVPTQELMRPGSRPARAEETPRNQALPFLLPFSFPGSASQAGMPHKQRAGTQETGTSGPSLPIQELPYNNPRAHSEQDPGPHAGGSREKLWLRFYLPPLHKECISQLNSSNSTHLHMNCEPQISTQRIEYDECPLNYSQHFQHKHFSWKTPDSY